MAKSMLQSVRRPVSWIVFACLTILVVALAACGGDNGSMSSSASSNSSTIAVIVKEAHNVTGDVYTCDPASITVNKGDKVSFTNQTDEIQDFDLGDAQKAGVDFKMDLNQPTTTTFNPSGTFIIKSEKGATITVTVRG